MIYTVTTNPNIDYYMDLRAPLRVRVGGINRSAPATSCLRRAERGSMFR